MNREALKLVATALLLGLAVIAAAHVIAYASSPDEFRTFNVAWASDRELLRRYGTVDWTRAVAELKRRSSSYTFEESTDLAFETLDTGFRLQSDRQFHTDFFEYSVAFLPKSLADWVLTVGPDRRKKLADSITGFVKEQGIRAQWNEPVDIQALEQLYNDLKTPERFPQLFSPTPRCGLDDRISESLKANILHILDPGVPGGAEALARLAD
jgi:hypothetical protein